MDYKIKPVLFVAFSITLGVLIGVVTIYETGVPIIVISVSLWFLLMCGYSSRYKAFNYFNLFGVIVVVFSWFTYVLFRN